MQTFLMSSVLFLHLGVVLFPARFLQSAQYTFEACLRFTFDILLLMGKSLMF